MEEILTVSHRHCESISANTWGDVTPVHETNTLWTVGIFADSQVDGAAQITLISHTSVNATRWKVLW